MRYLVRVGEIQEKIDYYKELLESIRGNIKELKKIEKTIVWEGSARTAFVRYYNNYIEELCKIMISLAVLINFLSSYCDNYGYEYLRLSSKYNSLTDWSDENGVN